MTKIAIGLIVLCTGAGVLYSANALNFWALFWLSLTPLIIVVTSVATVALIQGISLGAIHALIAIKKFFKGTLTVAKWLWIEPVKFLPALPKMLLDGLKGKW